MQNVDKWFVHYLKYFRPDREVAALMQVTERLQDECGCGVFSQQGRHKCMLTGTVSGRPEEEAEEDAMWTECAELVNSESVVGKPTAHVETLYFTEACTHFFEENIDRLHDLSDTPLYEEASPYRKEHIERFCTGIRKFAEP